MDTTRRDFLGVLLATLGGLGAPSFLSQAWALSSAEEASFAEDEVLKLARSLAKKPYQPPSTKLAPPFDSLGYDQYRDIRFLKPLSFGEKSSRFSFDLFHTGFVFRSPVDIYLVRADKQKQLTYDPSLFDFGSLGAPSKEGSGLGYSGLRLRFPLNTPQIQDEWCVFQGASYFRAVGKGQNYGLSARGLAIDTAQPKGEEFPVFKKFWIKAPPDGQVSSIVVEALLDSPSVTGAYRFTLRPGDTSQIDVELTLFARQDIPNIGIAPMTSMFLFDSTNRYQFDDYRSAVHDSDGLAILNGQGEWIWRPLLNPKNLQISAFLDHSPRGFGLLQRKRHFEDFEDAEALYHRRPSLWVEPVGDWGEGHVELIEIPTDFEINDNIVAYWKPHTPVTKGTEIHLTYRLQWCETWPAPELARLAQVTRSSLGKIPNLPTSKARLFVVDFDLPAGKSWSSDYNAKVTVDSGKLAAIVTEQNETASGVRVHFQVEATSSPVVELRVRLFYKSEPASETWLYRWVVA